VKPAWLVVSEKEHPTFIESALPDKAQHNFAKNLAGWQNWYKVPSGSLLLFEGCFKPTVRFEWVTGAMAEFLTLEPLAKRGTSFPEFFQEGLKRFFSGHVAGRAEIFYANTGSSTSKRSFESGTLDTLRSHVRRALQQAPEGELRALLTKKTNDLDQLDSAIALAFFDFMLAKQRGELAAFLAELKENEGGIATFERVMKKSVEDVEAAFRVWVREEY
jgi:hypothetical protein